MKITIKKIIMILILIGIMSSIFVFSSHTAAESSALSIKVTRFISRIVFFNYKKLSTAEQQFIVSQLHPFIRKLAHFTVYMTLGIAMYLFWTLFEIKGMIKFPLAWILCAAYAAADEYHQSFTPGRSMQLTDVMIDSCGALCGIIAAIILIAVFEYIKKELSR